MFPLRYCCYWADRTAATQLSLFPRLLETDEEPETDEKTGKKSVRVGGGVSCSVGHGVWYGMVSGKE